MNGIKFPIAIDELSGGLVNILDVKGGGECGCICYKCKGSLIAINKFENKQKPHFRHYPESNCDANFESYIHWLAKEVICSSEIFTVPEIHSRIVLESSGIKLKEEIEKLFEKYKVPEPFRKSYRYKFILQESKSINIDSSTPEVIFRSKLGIIKVDIKIECQGQNLLVEPFFTHPIDEIKKNKIKDLDETVIDIDLSPFGPAKGYYFTLEEFRRKVLNGIGLKSWVNIKSKKNRSLQRNLLIRIKEQLINSEDFFKRYVEFEQEISAEEDKLNPIKAEIQDLAQKLIDVQKKFGEECERIQILKNKRYTYGNSFLNDNPDTHKDPWHLRSFDD